MKKFYQSKTLWFAVLFAAVQVASLFGYGDYSPSSDVAEIVNIGAAVIVLFLRLVTNKGVEL